MASTIDLRDRLQDYNREHSREVFNSLYLLEIKIKDLLEDGCVKFEGDLVVQKSIHPLRSTKISGKGREERPHTENQEVETHQSRPPTFST